MIRRVASHVTAAAGLVAALTVGSLAVGTTTAASAAVPSEDRGYVFVNSVGAVIAKGGAHNYGSPHVSGVVGIASTSNGKGYWVATKTGSVYALGGARYGAKRDLSDVVGIAGRPGASGYWLVTSTGRVYAYGGATNYGSIKKTVSNVIGIAPTHDGQGYWIATKTGQIFHYGDAKGVPSRNLKGIVSIAANAGKGGFWLLRNNGQVYRFGNAAYYGEKLAAGSVSIVGTPNGKGYWVLTSHGAVSHHGNATSYGGRSGTGIVALSAVPSTAAHVSVATRTLPNGSQGDAYNAKLMTTGGMGPVTWSRSAGTMPPGLSLTSTGVLRGTPSRFGSYSVEFTATDSSTPREKASRIISIRVGSPHFKIATSNLPTGYIDLDYSATLRTTDGVGPVTWSRIGGSLPAGLTLSSKGKITGAPDRAQVTSVKLRAIDAAGKVSTAWVNVAVSDWSINWAGYVDSGTNFNHVAGTFNVPSLTSKTTAEDDLAVWVGVDGFDDGSLLQAGVALDPNPAHPGTSYRVYPWWEKIQETDATTAPSVPIDSLTVTSGDQVTVSIDEQTSGQWVLTVTDDTTGDSYSTPPMAYNGWADSAEWIVEAPAISDGSGDFALTYLAPFSPNVTFSNLQAAGSTSTDKLVMLQPNADFTNLVQVATPSAMDANGFSVAYGATAPPAP